MLPNKPRNKYPVSDQTRNTSDKDNLFSARISNEIPDKHLIPNMKWVGYAAICLLALGLMYYASKHLPSKKQAYHLRKEPITVSEGEALKIFGLKKDSDGWYRPLDYVGNDFNDNKDGTITDRATGLMWQKSGSGNFMKYELAELYIAEINRIKFAGYDDWRLPTVDELASLLTPKKQSQGLYISPIFADTQSWCWTSDKRVSGGAWHIYFLFGSVDWYNLNVNYFVRAVRSLPHD
jgi:hypothetical protein